MVWSCLASKYTSALQKLSTASFPSMLHGIKLVISGRGDKFLLEADQRLREADRILTELQRWFPQVQAAYEENEKIWMSLGYNTCTMAKTAREIFSEDHRLQLPLDSLSVAGECILKPPGGEGLIDERSRTAGELRAFNDCIRQLRAIQTDCITALKNKEYYAVKLESIRATESKKKKKMTDREAERRQRNEQKLNDYSTQLAYQTEKLQTELQRALDKKELILEIAVCSFIRTQDFFFSVNPIPSVLTTLMSRVSPRAMHELDGHNGMGLFGSVGLHSRNSMELQAPPRAPSPVMKSGKEIIGVGFRQGGVQTGVTHVLHEALQSKDGMGGMNRRASMTGIGVDEGPHRHASTVGIGMGTGAGHGVGNVENADSGVLNRLGSIQGGLRGKLDSEMRGMHEIGIHHEGSVQNDGKMVIARAFTGGVEQSIGDEGSKEMPGSRNGRRVAAEISMDVHTSGGLESMVDEHGVEQNGNKYASTGY